MVRLSPGLERPQERSFFCRGLEGTVTELRGRVDELEIDFFEIPAGGVNHERLAEGDDTFLGTGDRTLEHQEVVLYNTIMGETTHGCNQLLRDIRLRRRVSIIIAPANAVDFLVYLSAVVVAVLTSTGNREHDLGRMPCTNTSNFAKTLVSLARKLLGTPTVGDTLETVTLGDSDNINTLVLLEDGRDLDRLLEEAVCKVDLVGDRTTVNLDLHKVCFLLTETRQANLSVCEDTDDSTVFADTLEFASRGLAAVLGVLLGVTSERLLLRAVPVLVEPTLNCV